ncbi:MAG: hypothetical protein ACR2QM_07460 [Longimicrobiales bacterium]
MSDKVTRTIHPETRMVDAESGLVDYVASDESVDSYNEVIKAEGWRFTHFSKNAPFLDSHWSCSISDQLGRVESAKVEGGKLVERVRWAVDVAENHTAQLGFSMTEKGYLKAVSVGFFPTKAVSKFDGKAMDEAKVELGIETDVDRIFLEQEQVELSACVIGANPNALVQCGAERDLAAVFGEEDLVSLEATATSIRELDALKAGADTRELAIISILRTVCLTHWKSYRDTTFARTPKGKPSGQPAPTRGNAGESKGHARENREEFLRELRNLTKGI